MMHYWRNFTGWGGNTMPWNMGSTDGFALMVLIGLVAIWSLVWKGLALWKAARRAENIWFIVLLIINTVGILDILYLYVFSKKHHKAISKE